jgi:hypothetical protein
MIDRAAIAEIVATYEKHGWVLRRVLLSSESKGEFGDDFGELFGDIAVIDSDVDAAWFSRPPKKGPNPLEVAWEVRHLSETPYALLEILDENAADFELSLQKVESRLKKHAARK